MPRAGTPRGADGRSDAYPGSEPAVDGDGLRVLCVDDDPAFAELTAHLVGDADPGLDVVTETDPEAALLRVATGAFDCVVCDYRRDRLDGLAFPRAVAERAPSVPCLLFTWAQRSAVAPGDAVDGYLRKATDVDRYETLARRVRAVADGS